MKVIIIKCTTYAYNRNILYNNNNGNNERNNRNNICSVNNEYLFSIICNISHVDNRKQSSD